jgi:hypothetical protein
MVLLAAGYAAPATVAAQDASKGAALLAEARRALGGEEKLRNVKALDVQGDFKRAAGQVTLEGELQIRLEVPDKLRRDEDFSLPGGRPPVIRTEVLNGSTVWDDVSAGGGTFVGRFGRGDRGGGVGGDGRGGRPPFDPAQIEEAQRRARQVDLSRFMLAWLLTTDGQASWIATAESPDGKADVIEITSATGPATRLFLDQVTHMPLMITWQGVAPQLIAVARGRGGPGGPSGDGAQRGDGGQRGDGQAPPRGQQATLQMTLADYKAVNGVKLPHLITRGVNDMTIEEWTIKTYKVNPSFRSDVFTR